MKERPKAHGNRTRIDPNKKITGENATNAVVLAGKVADGASAHDDELVELARAFAEENQQ